MTDNGAGTFPGPIPGARNPVRKTDSGCSLCRDRVIHSSGYDHCGVAFSGDSEAVRAETGEDAVVSPVHALFGQTGTETSLPPPSTSTS
jgi:hypothetical protein